MTRFGSAIAIRCSPKPYTTHAVVPAPDRPPRLRHHDRRGVADEAVAQQQRVEDDGAQVGDQADARERVGVAPVPDGTEGLRDPHQRCAGAADVPDRLEHAGSLGSVIQTPGRTERAGPSLAYRGQMTTTSSFLETHALPQGVVTFLFTDIQGSTRLLHRLGDEYADVLDTHRRLLREAFAGHGGHEVDTQGDSFFVVFASVKQAIAAACEAQQALQAQPWPRGEQVLVRMGLHTGEPLLVDGHYIGMDVHRAARIAAAGHGGQVLVSSRTLELAGGVPVKDLGEHRLKDLERPERIYQLEIEGLPDTFAPLKSLGSPTNVPRHLSTLVGRTIERAELLNLVVDPAVRLVTVTGPGGTGKTRLAAAVALDALTAFPDGVFFVDLTTTTTADLVAPAVLKALELETEGAASGDERLVQHLRHRKLLLVLDNFEQVLPGAVPVSRVLESCGDVKVLATSRVPLAVQGEQEYPLDTLSLPRGDSLAEVAASDAAQLFAQKAAQARPTFRLTEDNAAAVAQVCRLLDGLPLGIELAAARTKLFTPQALVRRLDDRLGLLSGGAADSPIRHRALRTTIDWSYDLLSPTERRFFCNLSVFTGGATFDAIEGVLGSPDDSVLDLVSSLVNHSLLREREDEDGEIRFHMLQVLRDYSLELAARDPERRQEVRQRHAKHFLDLARRVRGLAVGASPEEELLDRDADNLQTALDFWLAQAAEGDSEAGNQALALAGALGYHWYLRGQAREGSRWLDQALACSVDPPAEDRAAGLQMLGVLLQHTGESERAVELLEEALVLHQQSGDLARQARCLNSLGAALRYLMRLPEAEQRLSEAALLRQQLGDPGGLVAIHNNLGLVLMDQGQVQDAKKLFEGNLVVDRQRGDAWGAACSLLNLGVAHLVEESPDEARPLLREALTVFVDEGDADGAAEALEACTGLAVADGSWLTAARIAGAAEALRAQLGLVAGEADRVMIDRWTSQCREQLDESAFWHASSEGAAMTLGQAEAYVSTELLAQRHQQRDDVTDAGSPGSSSGSA